MTTEQFLFSHKQSTNNINIEKTLADCIGEMEQGLKTSSSSVPMIPTYLQNIDRSKIKQGKRTIIIDAGGTNFRSAIGYFDEQGKVVIENVRKTSMPAVEKELSKEEFYDQIAQNIRYLLDDGTDIGFCFSYNVAMGKDVDGIVGAFSKEVKAPQVVGTKVGAETLNAVKKYNSASRKIVILNDTVATLLGGMAQSTKKYSAYVGYIYGTGTNVCYAEDISNIKKVQIDAIGKMLINTEVGGFNKVERGDFDQIVANSTSAPHLYAFEKMTSGKYLADVIYQAFLFADKQQLFSQPINLHEFQLKDISAFLEGEQLDIFQNEHDIGIAKEICQNLVDRAAKLGAIINSSAAIKSCKDKSLPVAIVCEGTTFNKLPGYRSAFCKYLTQILGSRGISYEIVQGQELNLVGTLMSTMTL